MKKNYTFLLPILFFVFLCSNPATLHSQTLKEKWQKLKKNAKKEVNDVIEPINNPNTKNKHKTNKQKQTNTLSNIKFEKGITLNAPNNFISNIEVQGHNGFLRFGDINSYGRYTSKKYDYNKAFNSKIKEYKKAEEKYFLMVKTKALSNYMKDIERNVIYKKYTTGATTKERQEKKFQHQLQEHLKKLAFNITTAEGQKKYFSNPDHINPKPTWSTWGGGGSDEFRQMEAYQSFLNDNLDDILKWSKSDFLKNGELEFYMVKAIPLGQYNFEKQGYLMQNQIYSEDKVAKLLMLNGKLSKPNWEYFPKNEFENNINREAFHLTSLILKMASSKAKNLKNSIKDYSSYSAGSGKFVFATIKIKLEEIKKRKKLNEDEYQEQKYKYSFSEPKIDIYADEALKEKIGEVKMFLSKEETDKIKKEQKVALQEKYNAQKSKKTAINVNDKRTYQMIHLDVWPQFEGCETLQSSETRNCLMQLINNTLANEKDMMAEISKSYRLIRLYITAKADGTIQYTSRPKKVEEMLKLKKPLKLIEPGYKDGSKVTSSLYMGINAKYKE